MKNAVVYSLALVIASAPFLIISGCSKSTTDTDDLVGNWIKVSPFGGYARSEAVVFTIGDKAYVGLGTSQTDLFSNFYEYNVANDYWTNIPDFPGVPRNAAVAFTLKNKGYVGTGYDENNYLNDMWQYDPANNAWYPVKPFPGTGRWGAVAFTIGDKAYIGSGYDGNYLGDFYEFNANDSTWNQRASLKGDKRRQATAFVLNGKGYVVSGNNNSGALNDLVMFDPAVDNGTWTTKRRLTNVSDESYDDDYTSIVRFSGVSFILDNKAYITTGENGSLISSTWEYDDVNDQWTEKTAFSGSPRTGAVAFSLNNRAFVLLGRSGSSPFDNMYEFQPNAEDNDDDN
jgi:N-acetylneuraminic acid mutarotase